MENKFTLDTTMKKVETMFPYTRSVLHSQFHIGGCSKCGYESEQTIEDVAKKYSKEPHVILDVLNKGLDDMNNSEITVQEFHKLLEKKENNLILDVREEWEYNIAHIPNSTLLSESNFETMLHKAKEASHVIVVCHHGMRSMNATLYLRESGIYKAKSLAGGIDAYSLHIDPALQRY